MMQASHYPPVYLGLGFSLVLAIACNNYLDIGYGSFAFEVSVWSFLVCWALAKSWKCRHDTPTGKSNRFQRRMSLTALALFLFVFLPIWNMPRAGAYLLAMLIIASLGAPLTPARLHMSAVAALALVLFAVSHYRADWTMLFYLLPFILTLVFTLVAQQLSRRAEHTQRSSLGRPSTVRLAPATCAATAMILLLGGLLYAMTPQVSWLDLQSAWGQRRLAPSGNDADPAQGQSGTGALQDRLGQGGSGATGSDWPDAEAMRAAAARPGMPAWQKHAITRLADLAESLQPARQALDTAMAELWQAMRQLWRLYGIPLRLLLLLLLIAMLLWAFRRHLAELQPALWCRTRLDWPHCHWFPPRAPDRQISTLYHAACRLLALAGEPRSPGWNPREYQDHLRWSRPDLADAFARLSASFEAARYGPPQAPLEAALRQARQAYRRIWAWS
ncbi:MAG: DUF4129 domain-containing protein [Azovibrio sp.]|nr:DUF4129 domain-containing protein [Azovibrio sp.]